jgi:hypothetical protein
MKKFIALGFLALSLIGGSSLTPFSPTALAQTGQVTGSNTETFLLNDLVTKRGKIVIGTQGVTTIEFDERIVENVVGNSDLLQDPTPSKANPNLLYLKAKESNGTSTLDIILSSGVKAQFLFSIDSRIKDGKRYVVKNEAPAAPAAINNPTAPTSQVAGSASASRATAPAWLQFNVAPLVQDSSISINFILSNKGKTDLLVDNSKLIVANGEEKLAYTMLRSTNVGTNAILKAGSTQSGSIVFENNKFNAIRLTWVMQELAGKSVFVLEREVALVAVARTQPKTSAQVAVKPVQGISSPIVMIGQHIQNLSAAAPNVVERLQAVGTGLAEMAKNAQLEFKGGKVEKQKGDSDLELSVVAKPSKKETTVESRLTNTGKSPLELDTSTLRIMLVDNDDNILASFGYRAVSKINLEPQQSYVLRAVLPVLPHQKWLNVVGQLLQDGAVVKGANYFENLTL